MEETTVIFSSAPKESWLEFYQEYLEVQKDGKNQIHCINTQMHKSGDKNKSAFVDTTSGIYHCSVCGTYSPYRFLVDLIGIDPHLASATVSSYKSKVAQKQDYHVDLWRKGLNKPLFGYKEFVAQAEAFLDEDVLIVQDYLASRGLLLSTLQDWNVGRVLKEERQEECIVFPYFLNGEVVGIKGRTLDGRKGSIQGATLVPYGVHRLDNAQVAIICEGETDTLMMYQALKNNGRLDPSIAIVGIPGAATFPKEWQRFFAHLYHIYVIPQADGASETMVANVQDRLGADRVTVLQLPWGFSDIGKDIADWVAQHSERELADLIPTIEFRPYALTTEEMLKEAENEVDWIIPNLLATQEKAMIIGAPKSMKTYLALHMTHCIANGLPVLDNQDWIPDQQRVLFVEEEGNITHFARRIKRMFPNGDGGNVMWLHKNGVKLDTEVQQRAFTQAVEEFQPQLIIFDPFKSLHNKDENDNTQMGLLWGIINAFIIRHPQTAIMFIHHVPKSEKGKKLDLYSARGAGISAAELDIGFGLRHSDTEDGTLYMSIEGREIPNSSGEVIIRYDENFNFKMDGFKTDISPTKQKDKNKGSIVGLLVEMGEQMTVREIADELELTDAQVRGALKSLVDDGQVTKGVGESDGGRKPTVYYI